jgi:hypothetical protein
MPAAEHKLTDAPPTAEASRPDAAVPRQSRRLSDKILVAFHHACDQHELDVAEQLLHIVETMLRRPGPHADTNRRRGLDGLVAAHERLWHLRNREPA